MNKIIQVDLGKYPMNLIFAGVVLVLTIIASLGEGSHISELNQLPPDRNELTSIVNSTLSYHDGVITAEVWIKNIYDITLLQHIKFINIRESYSDLSVIHNHTKYYVVKGNPNKLVLTFQPVLLGNVTIELLRAKTLIANATFFLNKINPDLSSTFINCTNESRQYRDCDFTNICFSSGGEGIFFFNNTFQSTDPFIRLNSAKYFLKNSPKKSIEEYASTYNIELVDTNTLVVDMNSFDPYSWKSLTHQIAPLAGLHNYESVLGLKIEISSQNSAFLQKIAKINAAGQALFCRRKISMRQLRPSKEKLLEFRSIFASNLPQTKKLILLLSETNELNITNIEDLINALAVEEKETIIIEKEDPLQLVDKIAAAQTLIVPSSKAISQAFWLNDGAIVIELVPQQGQCNNWSLETTAGRNVRHFRFLVGNSTELINESQECDQSLNSKGITTASVDVFEIKKAIQ